MRYMILLLTAVLLWAPLAAQYTTASLGGTVLDSTGSTIPQARITVRNVGTGFTQKVSTDATGAFLFSRLPVGDYELRVEKEGFSTYVQAGITLTVNQAASQNVTLSVGQVSEPPNENSIYSRPPSEYHPTRSREDTLCE